MLVVEPCSHYRVAPCPSTTLTEQRESTLHRTSEESVKAFANKAGNGRFFDIFNLDFELREVGSAKRGEQTRESLAEVEHGSDREVAQLVHIETDVGRKRDVGPEFAEDVCSSAM